MRVREEHLLQRDGHLLQRQLRVLLGVEQTPRRGQEPPLPHPPVHALRLELRPQLLQVLLPKRGEHREPRVVGGEDAGGRQRQVLLPLHAPLLEKAL